MSGPSVSIWESGRACFHLYAPPLPPLYWGRGRCPERLGSPLHPSFFLDRRKTKQLINDYLRLPIHCASNAWWGWRAQNGGVCGEPLLSSGVWIKKCSDSLWGQKKETNATTFSVALGKTSFFECSCACACFLFFYLFLKKRPSTLLQILDSCYKRRGSGREKNVLVHFWLGTMIHTRKKVLSPLGQ